MVASQRKRIAHRALRWLGLCALGGALWYGFSYNRDYLFFYVHKDTIVRDAKLLQRELAGTGVDMQSLGTVTYGTTPLPLWVLRQPAAHPNASTVCLMAGVHGNEPADVQALLALAQHISQHPADYDAFRWVLLPLANPWGWERDLRHNGGNRDVARQFVDGDAQESLLLKRFLASEHCGLFVDLHEDRYHPGFYLLAYAEPQMAKVRQIVHDLAAKTGLSPAQRGEEGVFEIKAKEFADIRLTTASLWVRMNGTPHSFVVESFEGAPMAERVQIHTLAIQELTRLLAR